METNVTATLILALQIGAATIAPPPERGWGPERNLSEPYIRSGMMTADDYPNASRRAEETGTVLVSYTITADGRALDCRVARSSGYPLLDEATCRIVETRYVLEPARDADGRAVEIRARQSVVWQLE